MKIGFKPMPKVIKILFVIFSINVAIALTGIFSVSRIGIHALGFQLYGSAATIWYAALLTACLVFLYSLWTRARWTVKYASIWLVSGILNTLISIIAVPQGMSYLIGYVAGIGLNLLFLYFIYKHRNYFEKR